MFNSPFTSPDFVVFAGFAFAGFVLLPSAITVAVAVADFVTLCRSRTNAIRPDSIRVTVGKPTPARSPRIATPAVPMPTPAYGWASTVAMRNAVNESLAKSGRAYRATISEVSAFRKVQPTATATDVIAFLAQ